MKINEQGRVLVITGDGKGKTTAALGLALRAVGHRMRVLFLQFIKEESSGEKLVVPMLAPWLEMIPVGAGFVYPNRPEEFSRHRQAAERGMQIARQAMAKDSWEMLVMDEIFPTLALGLLSISELLTLIEEKPSGLHLILTGRNAPAEVIEIADTVSEIRDIKHAFHQGIPAQRGIEFW